MLCKYTIIMSMNIVKNHLCLFSSYGDVANSNFICFVTFPFVVLSTIPNYTVWLESLLRVEFNSSKNCGLYFLFRQNFVVDAQLNVIPGDGRNFITFTIPSVSIAFNNVTMTVQAEDIGGQPVYKHFFIYTQGWNWDALLSITCMCTNFSIL